MMVTLAVEAISRVDASAAIIIDVQNTLVNYPDHRYGNDAQKAEVPLEPDDATRSAPTRSPSRVQAPTPSASRRAPSFAATTGS